MRSILTRCALVAVWLLWPAVALADLAVVATLPSLGALAREVGGDHVTVDVLVSPLQDPHYADPRPDLVLALNKADMLVSNGLELEIGWLPTLQTQARNPAINRGGAGFVDASTVIAPLQVQANADRSQGDVHPRGNPHYLFDPRAAARVAGLLAERMAELDPANEDRYMDNAAELVTELETFARAQQARFAALTESQRRVVTYHQSMVYLFDWLDLTTLATVEPLPGIPPNPAHVAQVLERMRGAGVKVIVQEDWYPASTSETLAELTGGVLVRIEGGARFDAGASYLDHVEGYADALHDALVTQ